MHTYIHVHNVWCTYNCLVSLSKLWYIAYVGMLYCLCFLENNSIVCFEYISLFSLFNVANNNSHVGKIRKMVRTSSHQLQLCGHSCWLHSDWTTVVLNAWRYHQSSGVMLPHTGPFQSAFWWLPNLIERFPRKQVLLFSPCSLLKPHIFEMKKVICFWACGEYKKNRSIITWFAEVIYSVSRIHSHQSIFVIRQKLLISSLRHVLFDYFHLVNCVADSLQRWISSTTIYQKPEHFRVCLRKSKPKNMLESGHLIVVLYVLDKHTS